ncbi:MAG TPA: TetR/AcrR family transcriptional regulator [Chakrabartia sp.]|jgi:AcrR family transcriptional regulator|nr:TetR/AcrR family transcriptional regulator [Chakrabartia sp.]
MRTVPAGQIGTGPAAAHIPLRERKKTQTRQQILHAARTCFNDRDIAEVSMDDIAETAQVARGTVFNYFPSKGDLVSALVAENAVLFSSLIERINERPTGLGVRLTAIFVTSAKGMMQTAALSRRLLNPVDRKWQASLNSRDVSELLLDALEETFRGASDAGALRADVPVRHMGELVLSIYTGIVAQWRMDADYPLIARLEQAAGLLVDMAQTRP